MNIKDYNFDGKKAIVRVDFNVPIQDGKITDMTRINGAAPTLKLILEKGGSLIIMSHMGKPKGKVKAELSLKQIVPAVSKALGVDVKFADDCQKADAQAAALKAGDKVTVPGIATLSVEERAARTGINPQTKEKIQIPAKKVVKFKAGSQLI